MNKNNAKNNQEKSLTSVGINWFPGHMAKTRREISEKLSLIDIVYEVIDARMPISSKIIDLDNLIKDKKRIVIFTKYDLCDKSRTDQIIKQYREKYPVLVLNLKSNDQNDIKSLIDLTNKVLKDINESRKQKGLKPRLYRALVVGAPNVGKSTLINRISKKKSLKTGNKAGVTKGLSWVRVGDTIELLDTPGILYPKIENKEIGLNLASLTSINEDILDKEEIASYIITCLYKKYPTILKDRYKLQITEFNLEKILEEIGKNTNCYQKGGNLDYEKIYTTIINDLKEGRIKKITFD